jgi:GT2 family glycosyltransferase
MPDELKQSPAPPRVSVILVSFQCVEALRRSLAALERSQDRETIEVFVADNGSMDGSARLDSEFPEVNYLRLEKNFGLTRALNIAARTAQGEYLFFLSPYIEVQPDTIPKLVARLAQDSSVGAVCPLIVDAAGDPSMRLWRLPDAAALSAAAAGGEPQPLAYTGTGSETAIEYTNLDALLVSKYFVRGMNFFDQRYGQTWQDAELCFQLRKGGKKLLVLNDVRVTRMDLEAPPALSTPGAISSLAADRAVGASVYAAKRGGFVAGLKLRMAAILSALGAALTFRSGAFNRLANVIAGQVIDGNQSEPH